MSASLESRAEFVTRRQCREVLTHLAQSPAENLVLIDLVREISDSGRDTGAQVVAAWEGDRISGVASLVEDRRVLHQYPPGSCERDAWGRGVVGGLFLAVPSGRHNAETPKNNRKTTVTVDKP